MKMLSAFLLSPLVFFSALAHDPKQCNCAGTTNSGVDSAQYICHDSRLGPVVLPRKLPLATFISDYDRFGGLTPGEFLKKWTNENGTYVFPPQNGFQLNTDGNAINGTMILQAGTLIDRFGGEGGTFVSAADAPFSQRALPPSSLNTNASAPNFPYNYHLYRVIQSFPVVGGPIAPWFGQPGLGAQFYTGGIGNIAYLINQGYLQREDPNVLIAGKKKGCVF
ncbi:hypothetical protein MAC_08927 [Metarhizium acridum CQMa 102]|uniref:TNT domain-containing protein n=1 Tax=Metarhizium acridum (strain CQMa 102) TaxID=655827 RepID=E9EGC9_METAQ|nr:uncharacterized protein MAC_08927 [Metarhizium acridum CQMa 102]EFY85044.1 hypothetical protein MAC_08927 [Metarhizium acridum CQMa 102]